MNPKNNPTQILDWVVDDKVPSQQHLADRVMKEAAQPSRKIATPRMKLATSLFVAVTALVLLSTLGYAIYKLVYDPGLQAVQDAGLVTGMDTTSQPTIQPTVPSTMVQPIALMIDQSQTVEGVSMTLDWVYLDTTRLLYGVQFTELPDAVSVGFPTVKVNDQPLGEKQQESKYLHSTASRAIYSSYQVLQPDASGDKVKLQLEIPLLRNENGEEVQAAVFQFSLQDVPLYTGQTLRFQQTAAVSVNGVEMQLRSLRLTPAAVDAVVCPSPASSAVFSVEQASLTANEIDESPFISTQPVDDQGAFCQWVSFAPQRIEESQRLTLTVNEAWKFYIDPPIEDQMPGIKVAAPQPTPQPVDAQSIDQVIVTLDWVFADAKRIAFGYTISGLPEVSVAAVVGGTIAVTDAQGNPYGNGYGGSSTIEPAAGQPGTLSGTWSTILQNPLTEDQINLNIDLTLDGSHGTDWNYTIGYTFYPSSGPTAEMLGSVPVVIPANLIGTYHFNVDTRVYPVTTLQPGQVMEVNGIRMELMQAELTASYSSFVLCYNKPSDEDWGVYDAELVSGLEQTSIHSYTLLSDNNRVMTKNPIPLPNTSISGENVRCVKLDFLLGHANQARTITLTVAGLERSMPEVFQQDELDAAYVKLKEQGIEMTYTVSRGVGGGGGGWEYTKLPEGMTDEEAYNRFIDALGYRSLGPWAFTFPFQP